MKIIRCLFLLAVLISSIQTLPVIFSSRITQEEESIETVVEDECPETEYGIVVEHFSQLIATHWQFDHLDTIISNTYRMIAEQFQQHIQITTLSDRRDYAETMDLEILHAQIFGAIQAHTEGSLPLAWDGLADKLSKQALEGYIRNKSLEYCTLSDDLVSSTCLRQKAEQLSNEMEEYIRVSLEEIYTTLDDEILPELLTKTSNDLVHILDYFNRIFFFEENEHLSLHVLPWTQQQDVLKAQLIPLLSTFDNDNHPTDFFSQYVCFSKA
ncbi:hypothetical protein G6F56_002159 [Rhizopus delemar]|uniref:Uncharacterized protein n=1 Tax=Rhizopus stolonifer TaxID=4846 RepID=A0A367KQC2_RHIST|nr:hypothetical protein G6F56_002159 [Rhizopus delemar]RCI04379.1 hypothetical protein CU098_012982 [Rhizopus stolonifer]